MGKRPTFWADFGIEGEFEGVGITHMLIESTQRQPLNRLATFWIASLRGFEDSSFLVLFHVNGNV